MAYEYRCAFCGYDGYLEGVTPGLEAAHVRWWTHGGPNDIANGICLCSIHHKLFDRGVLGISSQHAITVSARFVGRSPAAEQLVISLSGRRASPPIKGFPPSLPLSQPGTRVKYSMHQQGLLRDSQIRAAGQLPATLY